MNSNVRNRARDESDDDVASGRSSLDRELGSLDEEEEERTTDTESREDEFSVPLVGGGRGVWVGGSRGAGGLSPWPTGAYNSVWAGLNTKSSWTTYPADLARLLNAVAKLQGGREGAHRRARARLAAAPPLTRTSRADCETVMRDFSIGTFERVMSEANQVNWSANIHADILDAIVALAACAAQRLRNLTRLPDKDELDLVPLLESAGFAFDPASLFWTRHGADPLPAQTHPTTRYNYAPPRGFDTAGVRARAGGPTQRKKPPASRGPCLLAFAPRRRADACPQPLDNPEDFPHTWYVHALNAAGSAGFWDELMKARAAAARGARRAY